MTSDYFNRLAMIATYLGGGWKARQSYRQRYLDGPDCSLFADFAPYHAKDRVVFSLVIPEDLMEHYSSLSGGHPRITVGLRRPEKEIAHNVERRLLPAARRTIAELRKVKESCERYRDAAYTNLDQLTDILGLPRQARSNDEARVYTYQLGFEIKVQAFPDAVNLEMYRLPHDVALAVCHTLALYLSRKETNAT